MGVPVTHRHSQQDPTQPPFIHCGGNMADIHRGAQTTKLIDPSVHNCHPPETTQHQQAREEMSDMSLLEAWVPGL